MDKNKDEKIVKNQFSNNNDKISKGVVSLRDSLTSNINDGDIIKNTNEIRSSIGSNETKFGSDNAIKVKSSFNNSNQNEEVQNLKQITISIPDNGSDVRIISNDISKNKSLLTERKKKLKRAKNDKDIYDSWAGGNNGSEVILISLNF